MSSIESSNLLRLFINSGGTVDFKTILVFDKRLFLISFITFITISVLQDPSDSLFESVGTHI